jgi:hypothetical protein
MFLVKEDNTYNTTQIINFAFINAQLKMFIVQFSKIYVFIRACIFDIFASKTHQFIRG